MTSTKLHTLSRAMAVAGNLTGLMDVLALELPEMGIASCYRCSDNVLYL